jgi:hypothetical protein
MAIYGPIARRTDVHNQILIEKDQLMIEYRVTEENIARKSKPPQNSDVEELAEVSISPPNTAT